MKSGSETTHAMTRHSKSWGELTRPLIEFDHRWQIGSPDAADWALFETWSVLQCQTAGRSVGADRDPVPRPNHRSG
jgi:hypothetical protein